MKILGITGGIGAGKSTITGLFRKLGAECIDADKIAKENMEIGGCSYNEIVREFGNGILLEDGNINRKFLGEIVFSDTDKLAKLNEITHKYVFEEMNRRIDKSNAKLVCLDVPLLFNCDFPIKCDKTLVVTAPEDIRIKRVINRDGLNENDVKDRIKNQMSEEEMLEKADYFVVNTKDEDTIFEEVKKIYHLIME